jgi:hypothetical protein
MFPPSHELSRPSTLTPANEKKPKITQPALSKKEKAVVEKKQEKKQEKLVFQGVLQKLTMALETGPQVTLAMVSVLNKIAESLTQVPVSCAACASCTTKFCGSCGRECRK